MNKNLIFIIICVTIAILLFSFILFMLLNKNINVGNNKINKSTSEIVNTILNMKSYNAQVSVRVLSNKNEHTYIIKQKMIDRSKYEQEVLEPENIQGITTYYDKEKLEIKNTRLNLSKIYENYPYIAQNQLWLDSFANDYNMDKNARTIEKEEEIIMSARKSRGKLV